MKNFTRLQIAAILSLVLSLPFMLVSAQSATTLSDTKQKETPAAQFPDDSAYKNSVITYNIIDASNSTFGYDVFVDGRLMIHQASIPSMPGNDGFKTKDDAAKVAELVMYKIRKGEMPPTVTTEELKDLQVIK